MLNSERYGLDLGLWRAQRTKKGQYEVKCFDFFEAEGEYDQSETIRFNFEN